MRTPAYVAKVRRWPSMLARSGLLACLLSLMACSEAPPPVTPPGGPVVSPDSPVKAAGPETVSFCNIEYLGDKVLDTDPATLEEPLVLRGWLGDERGAVPHRIQLQFSDAAGELEAAVPVVLGVDRSDVAAVFPERKGLEKSGFELALDPADLPAGTWRLSLLYAAGEDENAPLRRCDNDRRLVIGAP
ncbi:hypothetical protein [Arenimonas sp. MALMAid1274]|uniref:hypothetical protein n=1 Tax=Arenimonas sp. MALMAid1274 TaxID=3411630 RepID=UPI003BA14817